MRKSLFLLVVLVIVCFTGSAQLPAIEVTLHRPPFPMRGLLVKSLKTDYITEGSRVRVKTFSSRSQGFLTIISDSSFVVNSDTIVLNSIRYIRANNRKGAGWIIGGTALAGGGILFGTSLLRKEDQSSDDFVRDGVLLFSVIPAGVISGVGMTIHGIIIAVKGKNYNSRSCSYKIIIKQKI